MSSRTCLKGFRCFLVFFSPARSPLCWYDFSLWVKNPEPVCGVELRRESGATTGTMSDVVITQITVYRRRKNALYVLKRIPRSPVFNRDKSQIEVCDSLMFTEPLGE